MQLHFWVYLLRCADGSFYAGHTDDLGKRLYEHQNGTCGGYTSKRRPVELVWSDYADRREDALAYERRIKGWSRAKKEALIAGDWATIRWLSKPPSERASTPEEGSTKRSFALSEVEGCPRERASTSLSTIENGGAGNPKIVRPERSRRALSTNEDGGAGSPKIVRPERSRRALSTIEDGDAGSPKIVRPERSRRALSTIEDGDAGNAKIARPERSRRALSTNEDKSRETALVRPERSAKRVVEGR